MIQIIVYRLAGVALFTVGLVFMPGVWWAKVLIWFGIGLLVQLLVPGTFFIRRNK